MEFRGKVPKKIKDETVKNMEKYGLTELDAFECAVKDYSKKGSELWCAWYYGNNDYRKFLPQCYNEEFLDFEKYPLKYEKMIGKDKKR